MADDSLLSGFVTVSDKEEARLRDLISQAPGKQSFGDDEMPDVLYSVRYHDLNGKVIDCEYLLLVHDLVVVSAKIFKKNLQPV